MLGTKHQEVGSLALSLGVGLRHRCVSRSMFELRPLLQEDAFLVLDLCGSVFLYKTAEARSRRGCVIRGLVAGVFGRDMLRFDDT